ncbi:DsbA family oxidoreductase [Solimonas sp. K1W22B-7]|uniref:DsbA family oxidoreductase n=1 Tax=Solimonas sp. K1W22B-7 TaxID=2303331 RepID=UPI000E333D50|nr:DsbA family oxidoreductase [Solimonas sp. K1W22B-7]AXQ30744.1 DsbA family oxidoreductase [Solimonas sp. K1W22B-7]
MTKMTIDFVSDVSCPFCLAGLLALEIALERTSDVIATTLRFHPYQLNPDLPPEGESLAANLNRKFGISAADVRNGCAQGTRQVAGLGFTMNYSDASGIYNTHDAHRLLHWAGLQGRQLELKRLLFAAYFSKGLNPSEHGVLIAAAVEAGLDPQAAREVLSSGRHDEDVRADEQLWRCRGVKAVPFIMINGSHVISGSQSPEQYESTLRQLASERAA